MSSFWSKQIGVEPIGGVPFRMYSDRPRRIDQLLPFAHHWGTRPYVVQGDRVVTFDALLHASAAKARALLASGVGRDDRVLILGWNSPDWILNFWACVRIGAVPLDLIEHYRISRWNAVPTMATRLLDHPDIARHDLGCLRTVTLGGAPVHEEQLPCVREGLPGVQSRIATGYGLSENGGQATAAGGADVAARPGSSGRPLPLAEVRILERPGLPDGEALVRSPTQMLGYFGVDSPIGAEGWLHTGDLGRLDENGHLWITGRNKDLIIRGGENIVPAAVEQALMTIPGVSETVVMGVPHPDLGEDVLAIVVGSGGLTEDWLRAQLRPKLASFAIPGQWRLRGEPLPVNQTGKVDKPALLAWLRAEG